MKYIITTFILLTTLQFSYSQSNHEVRIEFTHEMTNDDLMTLQSRMGAMGYHIDFQKTKFDSAGKLISLKLRIETEDGFKGTATAKDLRNSIVRYTRSPNGEDEIRIEKLITNRE